MALNNIKTVEERRSIMLETLMDQRSYAISVSHGCRVEIFPCDQFQGPWLALPLNVVVKAWTGIKDDHAKAFAEATYFTGRDTLMEKWFGYVGAMYDSKYQPRVDLVNLLLAGEYERLQASIHVRAGFPIMVFSAHQPGRTLSIASLAHVQKVTSSILQIYSGNRAASLLTIWGNLNGLQNWVEEEANTDGFLSMSASERDYLAQGAFEKTFA